MSPEAEVETDEIVDLLVLEDVYLAQALIRGNGDAWSAFEELLERCFRSVRSHFSGQTPRVLLEEIRESVLGTFFMDDKVSSFRATAPIVAWARQVVFNLFRQRINQRRSGREAPSLSQLIEEGGDPEEALLPPSRGPTPPELLHRAELATALKRAVPEALKSLDRDEQRMLAVLPTKKMTQIELAEELGVSPFKMNRWYKEVRQRFMRAVSRHVREVIGLDEQEAERLIDHLAALWANTSISQQSSDLAQPGPPG